MDLNLLSLFVAVAEAGSFTAAARKLGLPKSSASRGVSALERDLGVQLLHRTTRKVAPSSAGAALLERVAPLLAQIAEAASSLPEKREEPSGVLRLTAPHDVGATLLAEAIPRFAARYPSVRVDARLTNRNVDLVAEGFDLALRASSRPLADSSLVARKLGAVELRLYASPGYLLRKGAPRTLAEAAGLDLVLFSAWRPPREMGRPAARIVSDDFFFIRETLRAGAGIGVLPAFLAEPDVAAGRLARAVPRWSEARGSFSLVSPARKPPRKVIAFRDFLLEFLAARPL